MGKPQREHNLQVAEIFKSLQGEGLGQGKVTTFVRLSGCNLSCSWCDSDYSQQGGAPLTISEILDRVRVLAVRNVCVTGGEPLLQADVQHLFSGLKEYGYDVSVETNGTIDISGFRDVDSFAVDYKLASAAPAQCFYTNNFDALSDNDALKFVIADRADYEQFKSISSAHPTEAVVVVSPCWGTDTAADLASWILADNLPVRFLLQMHKLIGVR